MPCGERVNVELIDDLFIVVEHPPDYTSVQVVTEDRGVAEKWLRGPVYGRELYTLDLGKLFEWLKQNGLVEEQYVPSKGNA